MTFFDFCEQSIEILPSFCLFRENPEIPDKIRRFIQMRQRREEVTCPILTPQSLLHMFLSFLLPIRLNLRGGHQAGFGIQVQRGGRGGGELNKRGE